MLQGVSRITGGSGGGGTIGGSIAVDQIAYGSAANTIMGDANFTRDSSTQEMYLITDFGGGITGGLITSDSFAAGNGDPVTFFYHGQTPTLGNQSNGVFGVIDDTSGGLGTNDPALVLNQSNNVNGTQVGTTFSALNAYGVLQATTSGSPNAAFVVDASGSNGVASVTTDDGGSFQYGDGNGNQWLNIVSGDNPTVQFGDLSNIGNGTQFSLNDGSKDIIAQALAGTFQVKGFGGVPPDRIALFDNANRAVKLGDVDFDWSGTLFTVDDTAQSISMSYGSTNSFLANIGTYDVGIGDLDGASTNTSLNVYNSIGSGFIQAQVANSFIIQNPSGQEVIYASGADFQVLTGDVDAAMNGTVSRLDDGLQAFGIYNQTVTGNQLIPGFLVDFANGKYLLGANGWGNNTYITMNDGSSTLDISANNVSFIPPGYGSPIGYVNYSTGTNDISWGMGDYAFNLNGTSITQDDATAATVIYSNNTIALGEYAYINDNQNTTGNAAFHLGNNNFINADDATNVVNLTGATIENQFSSVFNVTNGAGNNGLSITTSGSGYSTQHTLSAMYFHNQQTPSGATYTITTWDYSVTLGSSGTVSTVKLPATGSSGGAAARTLILNNSLQANSVTVTANGTNRILYNNGGSSTYTLIGGASITLITDGLGNWYITGSNETSFFPVISAGTGAQTINSLAGSVNFAAAATSLVVTNSFVTANSVIIATVGSNDATMKSVATTQTSGSFTIFPNVAPTGTTRVNFLVIN